MTPSERGSRRETGLRVHGARVSFTPALKKRLTGRALRMIERALARFPELADRVITIGHTTAYLGSASIGYRNGRVSRLIVRLKLRRLSYQTIGHELTHLVQGLTRGERRRLRGMAGKIPSGEKQCDIWTLARDPLFCDEPPTYLRLPGAVRERWDEYAAAVRGLCVEAIERRPTQRLYIRWLEGEIRKLVRREAGASGPERELTLPF